MLVLTRRVGEKIVIDGRIEIIVLAADHGRSRLGIVAPDDVRVDRFEIHERRAILADAAPAREGVAA